MVEMLISTGIFGVLSIFLLLAFNVTDDAINEGVIQTDLDMKAASIVERIANDLKDGVGTVTTGGSAYPAYDGITITIADGNTFTSAGSGPPNFSSNTTINYVCYPVTRNGQTFNCLERQSTSTVAGVTTTTKELLTDELSGNPFKAALGDDIIVSGSGSTAVHKIRIPINPIPGAGVPAAQQVPRAVYIAANLYSSSNSNHVLGYVDVGVTLARINFRRQRNNSTDETAYTQLGYAHAQIRLNNNCSVPNQTTSLSTTEPY